MLPRIRSKLVPETEGKALLQITFDSEVVAQKEIFVDDLMDKKYPDVTKALACAEDSPLFTLAETITNQLQEALDMIESNLPDEYNRIVGLETAK